ncbi:hypothetical protein D3248_04965 [Leucobacter zeae]|nr:hypothetical protein [Leucobacter zeae]
MADIWDQNEELDAEEELVVTDIRDDRDEAAVDAETAAVTEDDVEIPPGETPRDALEALGEDVASSPAQRGHDEEAQGGR